MRRCRVITILVDFYLKEDKSLGSPISPGDIAVLLPHSRFTKKPSDEGVTMGDKLRCPPLNPMVLLIAEILKSDAAPEEMDAFEFSLLSESEFLPKLLRTQTSAVTVVDVIKHICWQNKQNTKKWQVIAYKPLRDQSVDYFAPYLELLRGLLSITDEFQVTRFHECMSAMKIIVDQNLQYSAECCRLIRFLSELCQTKQEVCTWLLNDAMATQTIATQNVAQQEYSCWMQKWLFAAGCDTDASGAVDIVVACEGLCQNLVPGANAVAISASPTGSAAGSVDTAEDLQDDEDPADDDVDDDAMIVSLPAKRRSSRTIDATSITGVVPTEEELDEPSKVQLATLCACVLNHLLTYYPLFLPRVGNGEQVPRAGGQRLQGCFRVLKYCLRGEASRVSLQPSWGTLIKILWTLDDMKAENDVDKGELLALMDHATSGESNAAKILANGFCKKDIADRFLNMFIMIRPEPACITHNRKYVPHFYNIVLRCARLHLSSGEDNVFMGVLLSHCNLNWALDQFFLNRNDYPEIAAVLEQVIIACASFSEPFRTKSIEKLLALNRRDQMCHVIRSTHTALKWLWYCLSSSMRLDPVQQTRELQTFHSRNGEMLLLRTMHQHITAAQTVTEEGMGHALRYGRCS